MKRLLISIAFLATLKDITVYSDDNLHPLSDAFINAINQNQSLWRAGRNFAKDVSLSYLKKLMGHKPSKVQFQLPIMKHEVMESDLPKSFDWRDIYPNCTSLFTISDQGNCGSCWVFGTVEAISDRICIHSDGKLNISISADDLLTCYTMAGGCSGGDELPAYYYWKRYGLVTGGPYNSSQGCKPYEIPPCGNDIQSLCYSEKTDATPVCTKTCRKGYPNTYAKDLHFGKSVYVILKNATQMQAEILKNGPVTVYFGVYEDFTHYISGIYKHVMGSLLGYHTVKILGWGVENDTPYWLIANSWNTDWGEKGYFRMIRGENNCGIENRAIGGVPLEH